ncbi:MAG TPA: hypothetical protein VLX61_05995 [Anaerolineales bacterium]|nr:hypothetical protein [Anaerolineales bacterium]
MTMLAAILIGVVVILFMSILFARMAWVKRTFLHNLWDNQRTGRYKDPNLVNQFEQ